QVIGRALLPHGDAVDAAVAEAAELELRAGRIAGVVEVEPGGPAAAGDHELVDARDVGWAAGAEPPQVDPGTVVVRGAVLRGADPKPHRRIRLVGDQPG